MRTSKIERKTKETEICVELNLDGSGKYNVDAPIRFFAHMIESFSKHGLFDIAMQAKGDVEVDQHHIIEDCGIVLGQAFREALDDKKGINRAGYFIYPMDDALAIVALDISGRPYLRFEGKPRRRFCGDFDADLLEDFFYGFSTGLQANIAIRMKYGRSDHHKIEALFKAFAKAMKTACSRDKRALKETPSTKGLIEK
ncbi:MAG: imidazoleglycerol-phosphate dehydratase HisB [Candidatus Woesearchaeota archaeon]|nr:imidazoleglycerol-phosphate dehydratase HisB [Candidatus Woesearchaeota archaeon]